MNEVNTKIVTFAITRDEVTYLVKRLRHAAGCANGQQALVLDDAGAFEEFADYLESRANGDAKMDELVESMRAQSSDKVAPVAAPDPIDLSQDAMRFVRKALQQAKRDLATNPSAAKHSVEAAFTATQLARALSTGG